MTDGTIGVSERLQQVLKFAPKRGGPNKGAEVDDAGEAIVAHSRPAERRLRCANIHRFRRYGYHFHANQFFSALPVPGVNYGARIQKNKLYQPVSIVSRDCNLHFLSGRVHEISKSAPILLISMHFLSSSKPDCDSPRSSVTFLRETTGCPHAERKKTTICSQQTKFELLPTEPTGCHRDRASQ